MAAQAGTSFDAKLAPSPPVEASQASFQKDLWKLLSKYVPADSNTDEARLATLCKELAMVKVATEALEEQKSRLVEVCNTGLAEKDHGEHFTFDPKTGAPMVPSGSTFEDILTKQLGLKPEVVNKTMKILSDMVTKGVGEKVYAKGFLVVITNEVEERFLIRIVPQGEEYRSYLYPAQHALPPRFNKHGGPTKLNVLDLTGAGKRFLQPDLVCTGGIIGVDAQTGDIVVSRAEANKDMRVVEGTYDGVGVSTLDDREAVGLAAQGRCVVLTCTPENCQIDGKSGGSMRVFFQGGGEGVEVGSAAGVRVVEVPTKAPATHLSGGDVEAEVSHPHYEFEPETGNPLYMEEKLPVALQNEFKIHIRNESNAFLYKGFSGRDVVNATLRLLSYIARVGVPVQTRGRPSAIEVAKGGLVIITDTEKVWDHEVLKKPEFNKYAHVNPPINVLTIFDILNRAALDQTALDFLADGAIVISKIGNVVASGVTVLDLKKGSVNGGKKTAAASSAAQGDGTDVTTFGIVAKLSEDDCRTKLAVAGGQKVTLFNGALPDGAKMGGKEGYAVPIRDPNAPAVNDDEFLRLAMGGHVAGVVAFTTAAENKGRVDAPRRPSGATALVVAAYEGRVEVIPPLLEAGAGVDVQTKSGFTALMYGAEQGHAKVVEMLLAAGADKDLHQGFGDKGTTALMFGAQKGHAPVVEMLLAAGADKDLQSFAGATALIKGADKGHAPVVEMLLAAGADKDLQTNKGATALIQAANKGFDKILDLLVKAEARLDAKAAGNTALGWANKKNHPKCVALLEAANAP